MSGVIADLARLRLLACPACGYGCGCCCHCECPTACDDDCETSCHDDHQPAYKRTHDKTACLSWSARREALAT